MMGGSRYIIESFCDSEGGAVAQQDIDAGPGPLRVRALNFLLHRTASLVSAFRFSDQLGLFMVAPIDHEPSSP
jgi:hypothetical protein